jgi:hypothetical protein
MPRGVPIEVLKYRGKNVITILADLFNEILPGEDMPQNDILHTYAIHTHTIYIYIYIYIYIHTHTHTHNTF